MKNKVGLTNVRGRNCPISLTQLSVNIKIKVYSLIVSESQFSNSQFYSRTFPINYISHNVRRFSRYASLGILGNENINNFNPMWKIMAQIESLHHPMEFGTSEGREPDIEHTCAKECHCMYRKMSKAGDRVTGVCCVSTVMRWVSDECEGYFGESQRGLDSVPDLI